MKKKVLILADYYIPSIKGGGPIQSIKNLVENLSDKIDFYIVTSDRDLGDKKPFHNIKTDEWVRTGNANVFYTDRNKLSWLKVSNVINSIEYDILYLNSFFSYKFSIMPILLLRIKKIPEQPIVLAPRGEFSPGALGLKMRKKKVYLKVAKVLKLYKGVHWHATSETEKEDIKAIFGWEDDINIRIADNLTPDYRELKYSKNLIKEKGRLKIIFISRIHPKKNLIKAIEFLQAVDGLIEFNIYGPIEDKNYWSECKNKIEKLPQNIKVSYKGIVEHEKIINTFKEHHVFLFPTLGENFGHVISEAFIGGCPVIISDQTPWKGLESQHVGWDINLTNKRKFVEALNYCVNLNNEEYEIISRNAFEYGKTMSNNQETIKKVYDLFTRF